MLHLGLTAMQIKRVNPDISEAAIDTLSVSGLVHFPPTEGGPLNYIVRRGKIETVKCFEEILAKIPNHHALFGIENIIAKSGITESGVEHLFSAHPVDNHTAISEFQKQRNETVLLDNQELRSIGITRGLQNQEIYLFPIGLLLVMLFMFGSISSLFLLVALGGYFVL